MYLLLQMNLDEKLREMDLLRLARNPYENFVVLKSHIAKMNSTVVKTLLKFDFTLVISLYFLIFSHSGLQTVIRFGPHNCRFAVDPSFFVLSHAMEAFYRSRLVLSQVLHLRN